MAPRTATAATARCRTTSASSTTRSPCCWQIESRKGVEAIDEIAAVDGVDGIFIGPADLSASLGHIGQPNHPEVQATIRHLYERTVAAGKAVGTLTPNHDDADRYIAMGMHFVAVGLDEGRFRNATQALRDRFMKQT